MNKNKKIIFSGVQPSGNLHIGNYLGAISQWVKMQEDFTCIFCVVDYHAITVKQDPKILREKIIDIAKIYIASGIDPKKSIIFKQSDIKEHTELAWVLNCTSARMSDLNKMTQFKDKAGKNQENVGVGLFDYPVLMAADILLYDTDIVPVGDDQLQHVELTRTLARRFNDRFGQTFKIPEARLQKVGARIMGLDDPTKKMSKSAKSELNYIALTDDPAKAKKKIMKATTDSDGRVKYDPKNKPGISNLMTIYSLLENTEIGVIEERYIGKGYGDFKKDLAEVVAEYLTNFQKTYYNITNTEIEKILKKGAKKLQPTATDLMDLIKKKIGSL
ncbi:tryptophan--tRNA ligase [Candidatus Falkowbacteria bacterium]|nr:tryptophan--tRNA ligase [Candidatus Falkowbacteria bacterium]